jgi:hypothetical protein
MIRVPPSENHLPFFAGAPLRVFYALNLMRTALEARATHID